jgi:hypothetical protein
MVTKPVLLFVTSAKGENYFYEVMLGRDAVFAPNNPQHFFFGRHSCGRQGQSANIILSMLK